MKLTPRDIELFKSLNGSGTGIALLDYLERTKTEILDPQTLNKDNVEARKESIRAINEYLVERIHLINKTVKVKNETE